MRRARRWVAGIAVLVATGSCIEPRPMVVAAIARPVAVAPAQLAEAMLPGNFALKGRLSQGGMAIGIVPAGTVALTLDGAAVPIAPDGAFLIAFDRDAGPSATLAATRRDGSLVSQVLAIAPRAWNISRLATLPKYPVPPADFDRLRPPELVQINAARRIDSGSAGWRQPFQWPATGRISTLFGSQRLYKNGEAGSYHSGIDIAVPQGTPVLAPADGVVILASDHAFLLEGNLLMIDHGMGLNSALMHLSRIVVTAGQRVARGEVVAYSGMTGRVTGPHLHWGLRWRNAKIDPLLVAGPMPEAR
ncbi:M23 family metallopeptidase [Sphingomonas sp.]|uniref:M23 family metallopeptidase n=1 Tax=Sphingomonas sp. TaxID=28214 RepID=UPI002600C93A|nr:M23 family metallopeptidase [Sphingomonas sp.]